MGTAQCSLQLFDSFLLLGIGLRGCASPPKRSLGSRFHFVFPTVIEIGSDLILAARLGHVAALQTFQHNLPLLFRGSLDSRLSRHSRLLAEAPSLTNFRVQFYWGALQLTNASLKRLASHAVRGREVCAASVPEKPERDTSAELAELQASESASGASRALDIVRFEHIETIPPHERFSATKLGTGLRTGYRRKHSKDA